MHKYIHTPILTWHEFKKGSFDTTRRGRFRKLIRLLRDPRLFVEYNIVHVISIIMCNTFIINYAISFT